MAMKCSKYQKRIKNVKFNILTNFLLEFIRLMDQDTIFNRFKLMLAEFLSTYILVILGCMSCVDILIPPPFLVESVALGFGLAVTIAVTVILIN